MNKNVKKILLVICALILIGGIVFGLMKYFNNDDKNEKITQNENKKETTETINVPTEKMSINYDKYYSDGSEKVVSPEEKEQPELSDETKTLISEYQKNPTDENYQKLKQQVIDDYDKVVTRKAAKLASLKVETQGKPGGEDIVTEMEEIVQDIYITYWNRINSTMLRFTDSRLLKWRTAEASKYEYIPVMGAGDSIYIKNTPVTNKEYKEYIVETGAKIPYNWTNGNYPNGEDDYPVNYITYEDIIRYCEWLTKKDKKNTYRLPTEAEWELAAGHMPKDADFNNGTDSRTSVFKYEKVTRGAHGAIDFWGNVWEWTSTIRNENELAVKGGSYKSERNECRTEHRKEQRDKLKGYDDVGFRVVQVKEGKEPEKSVELTTLNAPKITATANSSHEIILSWNDVEGATEYQIFVYDKNNNLVRMLDKTKSTSVLIIDLESNTEYGFIVQPISNTNIGDNVSGEYAVYITTK